MAWRRKDELDYEREEARVALLLIKMPARELAFISVSEIKRRLDSPLGEKTILRIRNAIFKSREAEMAGTIQAKSAEEVGAQIVLERIAAIASKTHAVLGDDEKIAETDAVVEIVRQLRAYDPSILDRNVKRALPKQRPNQTSQQSARS